MISVLVATYNHSKYIVECLDSILGQKVNTKLEILIGDDGSTDGTFEICQSYQTRFPEIVKVYRTLPSEKYYIDGKPSGRKNLINLITSAKGDFVAFCEGDDYWISNEKLNLQLDKMKKNPDLSVIGHCVYILEENKLREWDLQHSDKLISFKDAIHSSPFHPNSWFFRNREFNFDENFMKLPMGDDPISIELLTCGNGLKLSQPLSVYRLHDTGTWSTLSSFEKSLKTLKFSIYVYLKYSAIKPEFQEQISFELSKSLLRCLISTKASFKLLRRVMQTTKGHNISKCKFIRDILTIASKKALKVNK